MNSREKVRRIGDTRVESRPPLRIQVGRMHYRQLNSLIREGISAGTRHFWLQNVTGQRYIGAGLDPDIRIEISGIPGQDLGVFLGGAQIVVHGNAQDGVGNTMNDGFLIVHGNVGDIPGHMVRNGKIYIKGSAGFRAGIMMKEYGHKQPVVIIGQAAGDYLGEYMAGGTMVVLGYSLPSGTSPVGRQVASGMFGGNIFVRGRLSPHQLGKGALVEKPGSKDLEKIRPHLEEFAEIFALDIKRILAAPFSVIRPAGERPYGKLYVPGNKIGREVKPVHRNLAPPCAAACPIGIPNPVIIRYLREGQIERAFELVEEYTPFRYSCCGMVCPGLCRAACARNDLGQPVRIDTIAKRYQSPKPVKRLEESKGERIAVIGAGPAGLAAAWHLARRGYPVEVYEQEQDLGGKLAHSVPEERLSRRDLEQDLSRIRSLGIRFRNGTTVDKVLFQNLRRDYQAIVIAVGAQKPKRIGFTGEEEAISSFQFLRAWKAGQVAWEIAGREVVILGAGNVAMDVACACHRLEAASVTAVDVRRPATFGSEVDRARSLGTRVLFPRYIESYRTGRVHFKNGEALEADLLIEALGELPELDFLEGELVVADHYTTTLPGVYAVGDAVGPGLVTHALAMGKKVAEHIHHVFRGINPREEEPVPVEKKRINPLYFQATGPFSTVLDDCFSCGTCLQCDLCIEHCPRSALSREGNHFQVDAGRCSGCGICVSLCPRGAITMTRL